MDKMKIIDGLMFPQIKRSAAEVQEKVTRETIPDAARVIKDTWEKEKFDELAFPIDPRRSNAEILETLKRKAVVDLIPYFAKKQAELQSLRKDLDAIMERFYKLKDMMIKCPYEGRIIDKKTAESMVERLPNSLYCPPSLTMEEKAILADYIKKLEEYISKYPEDVDVRKVLDNLKGIK